jgi:3-oxoacyl-[acyl-carrier protein] reductase
MQWNGSVVVITGASRGIGKATALAAAGKGATVGLMARTEAELAAVLKEAGGKGAIAVADVGDGEQIRAALAQLERDLGPVDILVANAGIGAYGPFADIDPADIERIVRVNTLGTLYAVRAVVPGMIERRRGHIVTIGSIAGRIGSPFEAAYAASKFAQVGFTEAISVELSPYNVGVSMVNPGPVQTDFFDARGHAYARSRPKQVPAEDVAAAVIKAVETNRLEQFVPRWFSPAVMVRHLLPGIFVSGTRRSMKTELAEDERKRATPR